MILIIYSILIAGIIIDNVFMAIAGLIALVSFIMFNLFGHRIPYLLKLKDKVFCLFPSYEEKRMERAELINRILDGLSRDIGLKREAIESFLEAMRKASYARVEFTSNKVSIEFDKTWNDRLKLTVKRKGPFGEESMGFDITYPFYLEFKSKEK